MGRVLESGLDQLRTGVPRLQRIYAVADSTIYVEGIYGENSAVGAIR